MSASARRIRTLAICLAIAVSAAPAVGQSSRPPTVDDILDLVQVSSPQISPDGSRVLFTQSEIRGWKDNKRVSSIWIANADGSNRFQFLGSGKDRSPRWSPDGAHVAFLSTRQSGEKASGEERRRRRGAADLAPPRARRRSLDADRPQGPDQELRVVARRLADLFPVGGREDRRGKSRREGGRRCDLCGRRTERTGARPLSGFHASRTASANRTISGSATSRRSRG